MELLLQTVIVVFTLGFIDAGYVSLLCGCLNVFALFDLCVFLISLQGGGYDLCSQL
jgi:hypothetical protein